MNINHFISELKRRNVFKVSAAYAIAGWLVIQVMATVSPQFNFPTWVPTLFTTIVLCGFPIAMIIAWAFEITPEGLKKTVEIDRTKSLTVKTGKKLNRLLITVLSSAIVFLAVERIFFAASVMVDEETEIGTASIAILPFVNMSSDVENDYFSDGLSEELLNVLAKVENLQVTGRTSSFLFKDPTENTTEIGQEVQVDNILKGSVRKSSNTIKITAQLIKVSDGYTLWSETYERELTTENIFEIQEEISNTVLRELKIKLLDEEVVETTGPPTDNIEAYNAFLEGTQLIVNTDIKNIEKAIKKYQEAIELDNNFAEAYARLAIAYKAQFDYGNVYREDTKKAMRQNIDKALLINGNTGRAYDALGKFYLLSDDSTLALETYERAVELLPNDGDILDGYHIALERNRQGDKADEVLKKAYEQDPLNPKIVNHYAGHISRENPEEAMKLYDELIAKFPKYGGAYSSKAHMLSGPPYNDLQQAFELTYKAYNVNPNDVSAILSLFNMASELNMTPLMDKMEDKLKRLYSKNESYSQIIAMNMIYSKNYDGLEKLVNEKRDELGNEFSDYLLTHVAFDQGDYKLSKTLIEKAYEGLFKQDSIVFSSFGSLIAPTEYAVVLKKAGDMVLYQKYEDAILKYVDGIDEKEEDPLDYKWSLVMKYMLTDPSKVSAIFEDTYFNLEDKIHTPSTIELHLGFLELSKRADFKSLKTRVYDDLHMVGARAIKSLQDQGIWREADLDPVDINRSF